VVLSADLGDCSACTGPGVRTQPPRAPRRRSSGDRHAR
jgi:hypothetical protein